MKKLFGVIFGYLFVSVFIFGFGGYGIVSAVKALHAGERNDWHEVFQNLPFAVLFTAVGVAFLLSIPYGIKLNRQKKAAQAAHPGAPWMKKAAWAKGEISASPDGRRLFSTVFFFAVFCMAASVVMDGLWEHLNPGQKNTALMVAGGGFTGFAIYAFILKRRLSQESRQAVLSFTPPAWIGDTFSAVIKVPTGIPNTSIASCRLICSQHFSKSRTVIHWQSEILHLTGPIPSSLQYVEFPISIPIPADCLPTDEPMRPRLHWRLHFWSGPNDQYAVIFTLPVFAHRKGVLTATPQ
ncbi:MAG TPA: hypothetical protein VK737_10695 [Opitutales bacterium]|jgi:hypothetical protein|nr:hypothetical protein [Opitutales bacterium]